MTYEINIEKLRKDLLDYFGTAMFQASPLAIMNLTKIASASAEELIEIATYHNFDLTRYIKNSKSR